MSSGTGVKERVQDRCLIDGEFVGADSKAMFEVTNPATDAVIARVPDCGASETWRAIEAASKAWPAWRALAAPERGKVLRKMAELMHRDQERLAGLMTAEQGKPLAESRGEVAYAASFLEWSAGEAVRVYGEMIPANTAEKRILVLRQPVGVCAAITPWNFPSAMITRKLGPALAAGCTMVVKPPEQTPLSALAIGELAVEAGVPRGVVNVVTGDSKTIGREIFRHEAVRKVSFTGSTEVGKILMEMAAARVVKLSLELGGTRRSSCLMMRTWTRRWRGASRPSSGTPGRRASAPIACWCRPASTTGSSSVCARKWPR